MSKYMRKTPVEAIQWTLHNQKEVYDFIMNSAKSCFTEYLVSDELDIIYIDLRGRKFEAVLPKYGWVVREGKTFQFYKDSTFRKTFEVARDDDNNGIDWERFINAMNEPIGGLDNAMKEHLGGFDNVPKGFKVPDDKDKEIIDTIIKDANKAIEDVRASIENGQMFAKYDNLINPDGRLTKLIDDLYKDDEKTREEIKKNMSEGLKEMAGSDTNKATFESVLDEMKELHAKKDKDYGSAFHKSFDEFGVTAGVVRLNDKMERVKSLVKNGKAEIKDESLLDSLKDAACYAVMLYVELKNKDNGKL